MMYPPLTPLTPREREVLGLIAQGKTNGEIARELGITFNTTKAHVSSVLGKLGVESRAEAARWWDRHGAEEPERPSVFARWVRGLGGLPWPRIGMAAGLGALGVAAIGVAALVVLVFPDSDTPVANTDATTAPTEVSPTPPAASPTAETTPTSGPSPDPTATPTLVAPTPTGLFTEPRDTPVDTVQTLPPSESPFEEWDGTSTIIYDLETGTEMNLGPGSWAQFNPSETMAAWVSGQNAPIEGGEAWAIDLQTSERFSLGTARSVSFIDDSRVMLSIGEARIPKVIDVRTGERQEWKAPPIDPQPPLVSNLQCSVPEHPDTIYPPYTECSFPDTSGAVAWSFRAQVIRTAGETKIAIATPVTDARTNIFLVDLSTGEAEYIASSPASVAPMFQIDVSDQYVVWSSETCDFDEPGMIYLFNRDTQELGAIETAVIRDFALTDQGELWMGGTSWAWSVVDLETLEYGPVLPTVAKWTPSRHYATVGMRTGRDGPCIAYYGTPEEGDVLPTPYTGP